MITISISFGSSRPADLRRARRLVALARRLVCAAWLTAGLFCALACASPRKPETAKASRNCEFDVPSDACEPVARAVALGLELFRHDKVAAVATDALAAHVGDLRATGVRGWVTARSTEPKGEWVTLFYRVSRSGPELVWRVRMVPSQSVDPKVEAIDPPRPAESGMRTIIRARHTALDAVPARGPVNPVILPSPDGAGILVYVLAPETHVDEVVLGIHYRVLVSADGRRVVDLMPLSRSAIAIPLRQGDRKAAAITVTHSLTSHPMEHHVFASILHGGLPIFVGTDAGLWEVRGDDVRFVEAATPER